MKRYRLTKAALNAAIVATYGFLLFYLADEYGFVLGSALWIGLCVLALVIQWWARRD